MGRRLLVLACVATSLGAEALWAQPLTLKSISAAQAMQVVEAARARCREQKMGEITVVVVDRAGLTKMALAADNASPHSLDLARRKAYTSRTFRMGSLAWAKRSAPGQDQNGQRDLVDVIPLGGGMPILSGEDVIGAVGVSGSSGGQAGDEACAKAGADSVAGK